MIVVNKNTIRCHIIKIQHTFFLGLLYILQNITNAILNPFLPQFNDIFEYPIKHTFKNSYLYNHLAFSMNARRLTMMKGNCVYWQLYPSFPSGFAITRSSPLKEF